jgi:biofilm PGA synthesis protein PgaA
MTRIGCQLCRLFQGIILAASLSCGVAIQPLFAAPPTAPADRVADEVRSHVERGDLPGALSLLEPYSASPEKFPRLYTDYLVILVWAGRSDEALPRFEALPKSFPRRPYLLLAMARAYADRGDWERSVALYSELVAIAPDDDEARQELVQARSEKSASADSQAQHARARLLQEQGLYWDAALVYARIVRTNPHDLDAVRQYVLMLSGLGATSAARRIAEEKLPPGDGLQDTLARRTVADNIRWGEYEKALRRLSDMEEKGVRNGDYVVALSRTGRSEEALAAYRSLKSSGESLSVETRLAAAEAFLAQQHPKEALALYEEILAADPALWDARYGKLYALQTLRQWKEADAWLEHLYAQTPFEQSVDGRPGPHPEMFQLRAAHAWYLAHQNRPRDAESAFRSLASDAPADLEVRNGLAHAYLWRGWPRLSLEEFDILRTLAPDYTPAMTGRAMALNSLAEKEQAREIVADLIEREPNNRYAQQTHRALQVEQMMEWRTAIAVHLEDSESSDLRLRTELSAPLGLDTRIFAFLLWRRSHYEDPPAPDTTSYFERAGIGIDHVVNAEWRLRPVVSINYDDGRDPGAALRVDYTPTDHWAFGVFGDSFADNIDGRAAATGIDAHAFGADAVWRQSEWRQAGVWYTRTEFSDDNDRDELVAGYEQNLFVKHDWRMRAFLTLYATWNSRGDETIYYNPERATSASLTHMTEQTVWQLYPRYFLHRLYLTGGVYRQDGYGSEPVGSVRYEQEHAFSDRHLLRVGAGFGRSVYDGESVGDLRFDMEFQWRF